MRLIFIIFNILIFSPDINYSIFWIPVQKNGLSFAFSSFPSLFLFLFLALMIFFYFVWMKVFLSDKVFDKRSEVLSIAFTELENSFVGNLTETGSLWSPCSLGFSSHYDFLFFLGERKFRKNILISQPTLKGNI